MNIDNIDIIVLFGPPGTGKGTLAQKCVIDLGWKHISAGSLCRKYSSDETEIGKKIMSKINNGYYIDDDLILEIIKKSFNDFYKNKNHYSKTLILDGFPRNNNQIDLFLNFLNKENIKYSFFVVLLEAPDEIVIDRLKNRLICCNKDCDFVYSSLKEKIIICKKCKSKLIKRIDDEENSISVRLNNFHKIKRGLVDFLNKKLINNFLLDASVSSFSVFEFFIKKFKNFKNNSSLNKI